MSPTNSLPSAPDLIRRIANRLPRAVTYGGQASGPDAVPDYDIYEAYLFSLIVGVAQDMGYAVDYLTSDLTSATTLHFRRKPAPIYSHGSASSSSGYRQFTHARLSYPGRADLELHVGVQVAGTSKVAHEADVLIIDSEAAAERGSAKADDSRFSGIQTPCGMKKQEGYLSCGISFLFLSGMAVFFFFHAVEQKAIPHLR